MGVTGWWAELHKTIAATSIQAYDSLATTVAGINWATDEFVLILLSDTYEPEIDDDMHVADLAGELSGVGYVIGGKTIDNVTATYIGGVLTFTADDTVWDPVTLDGIRYGVIADLTAADQPLVGLIDFDDEVSTGSDGSITVTWP